MTTNLIDLDAPRREITYPDGIPVKLFDQVWTFPAELPLKTLDPLLDDRLDLMGIVAQVLTDQGNDNIANSVVDLLLSRPHLPATALAAFHDIYRSLLGIEQYARFEENSPSIPDYVRLTKALATAYGATLGKLFGSPASPETGGPTSSTTSPSTTGETLETSGDSPATPTSSESAG